MYGKQRCFALSPQQPFDGQRMLRVPGLGRNSTVTNGISYGTYQDYHGEKRKKPILRMAVINLSTARRNKEEVAELIEEKRLDVLGICETRFKGNGDRIIHEKFRLIYIGGEEGRHGVGIVLLPILKHSVVGIQRESFRIMSVSLCLVQLKIGLFQVYASQQGRLSVEKDTFVRDCKKV